MNSATSEANIVRGQAARDKSDLESFSQKLKAVQDKAAANNAKAVRSPEEDKKLRKACQEMEALFLNLMLSKMRDTVPERTLFPKSSGEKIMQSMMDVELTRTMSQAGGIGLGNLLYNQLTNPGVKHIPEYSIKAGTGVGTKKQ